MADRLSDLPESLQLRILSCLDARDVVQTMVLSRSWVSTWASTPVLNFSSNGFRNVHVFHRFVVDVLARRQPVKLDRLILKHDRIEKYWPESLEGVFDYALSHGVEELEADIEYNRSWQIGLHNPSDSLTSLKLLSHGRMCCLFMKPRSGSFKNLTNLHLKCATITDRDPFSGFPELVKLTLDFCSVGTEGMALKVHAPKLLEFTILCYIGHANCYEFTTPKLRYFEWRGADITRLVTHEGGFPVLDTVVMDLTGYCPSKPGRMMLEGRMFDELLMWFNTLHNARSLTLFSPVVHLLTLFPLEGCSPFRKLKCLKLNLRPFSRSVPELLKVVPGLKAYLLPVSPDAMCSVRVTDSLRPHAMAVLDSAFVVN